MPLSNRLSGPRSPLRWLLPLAILLLSAWIASPTASAHALLVRSVPEANAELQTSPTVIEMWFSEALESSFSHARLLDAAGNEVAGVGPSAVHPEDPTHMTVPVPALEPGIYTVVWTTLSQVDGHEWIGSFPLTILNPDGSRPSGDAPLAVAGERGELPSPVEGAARWLSLLGGILLAGGLLFRTAVAGPVLSVGPPPGLDQSVRRAARPLALAGVGGILLGGWLQIGAQVVALGTPERMFDLLVNTRPGLLLLLRQLLLIPLVGLLVRPQTRPTPNTPPSGLDRLLLWLELPLSLGLLLTFSLSSHAAAVPGRGWAVIGDFIHLVAAALWMGGLLALALLFWQSRNAQGEVLEGIGRIVRRFSLLAAAAVFVLTVTGLFSSAVQLPSLAALWESTYGLLLLAKLGLVALALGVAFLNNRIVHRGDGNPAPARLMRQVWGEALVSLALLVVVALLVQTPPPPRPRPAVAPALPFVNIAQAGDLLIHLQISPNQPGNNRFWTHLYHPDGSEIGEVQLVRLFFAPERAELGQARTDLPTEGGDIYVDSGAWMGQSGKWDVTVYVRRRGMDDVTAAFAVTVPPPPGVAALGTPWQNPAAALSPRLLAGLLLLALGLVPLLWWRPLRRRRPVAAPAWAGAGLACLAFGLLWAVQGLSATGAAESADRAPAPAIANAQATPVIGQLSPMATVSLLPTVSPLGTPGAAALPDAAALPPSPTPTPTPDADFLAGAAIYETHCIACHGPHGMGDGPAATALPVQPAVLPFHVPLHPNEDVYVFVSQGFPNLGMPAFAEILSEEELLQVVRYLRVRFGGGTP